MAPAGTCPLCGGSIEEIEQAGHAHHRDRCDDWLYTGRCLSCDIDFICWTHSHAGKWRIVAPEATKLLARVEPEEIHTLTARLQRYEILGAKWLAMLERQRPGDEVWRFTNDTGHTGIAIVRGGVSIHSFDVQGDL